jgi:hypothetical protein
VVGAVWELDDVADGCRQMLDVRGAPPLVGDHAHLVLLLPEGEHRPNEVLSRRAEEPGAPDDPAFFDLPLSLELRLAVDGQRIGLVGLDVRLALRTVEDVIGGEVDDRRAHGDDVSRAKHVDALDRFALGLRRIDVCPCGRMENELGSHRERPRDVVPRPISAREHLGQRGAELAAWAGDQEAASRSERIGERVAHRCLTRSSSHGMACSSGSVGSYSSVTW